MQRKSAQLSKAPPALRNYLIVTVSCSAVFVGSSPLTVRPRNSKALALAVAGVQGEP